MELSVCRERQGYGLSSKESEKRGGHGFVL